MNRVVGALRKRGVLIIHCPSGTLAHYRGHPARKLAQAAPEVKPPRPLKGWCPLDKAREGALPIDDSDGGCGCQPRCKGGRPWRKQIEAIEIAGGDALTDSAEAYYLMRQRGITNLVVMGVHTNMCVLGRPFGIRQMVYQGQNVLLMRDLTDTMYNPRARPFVSHFEGTELVVEHIEKHWCATVTSDQVIGGEPFRFRNDKRRAGRAKGGP
jgi:nicotinamidase-related amidase